MTLEEKGLATETKRREEASKRSDMIPLFLNAAVILLICSESKEKNDEEPTRQRSVFVDVRKDLHSRVCQSPA